jgi:hypothetical protein
MQVERQYVQCKKAGNADANLTVTREMCHRTLTVAVTSSQAECGVRARLLSRDNEGRGECWKAQ